MKLPENMYPPKPKLRWKREPRPTGLRAIGAGPRGYEYHDGTKKYASVYAHGGNFSQPTLKGWYWVAGWGSDVPHKNTCNDLCNTPEEAKKQAEEYVKQHLNKK